MVVLKYQRHPKVGGQFQNLLQNASSQDNLGIHCKNKRFKLIE